ncbi:DUF4126 domain-containing protein [Larkinella knui]|uniref:DUF4126 domain-containing protein n=1 Tax=Larkinella knui TaxID=2025310 RepID=A0A3P1CY64_9BACT|nr:DUF4126 domain-containing protein [Larkinella knui]RRB18243.1 DUF4126 domain-containing protein [Larkinella knui]
MEWLLSLCLGIALSACCGFRIFVPLLVASLAIKVGWIAVTPGFEWMSSWTAVFLLATATIIEIGAYYIPWLDNALDTVATPIAFVAGTILTTSFVDIDVPMLKWGLGLIAGGGTAGLIQAGTSLLRIGSTATTGGLGNPVIASAENVASFGLSLVAVFLPLIAAFLVLVVIIFFIRLMVTRGRQPRQGA